MPVFGSHLYANSAGLEQDPTAFWRSPSCPEFHGPRPTDHPSTKACLEKLKLHFLKWSCLTFTAVLKQVCHKSRNMIQQYTLKIVTTEHPLLQESHLAFKKKQSIFTAFPHLCLPTTTNYINSADLSRKPTCRPTIDTGAFKLLEPWLPGHGTFLRRLSPAVQKGSIVVAHKPRMTAIEVPCWDFLFKQWLKPSQWTSLPNSHGNEQEKRKSLFHPWTLGELGKGEDHQWTRILKSFSKIYCRMEGCTILPVNESNPREGKTIWPESGWDLLRMTCLRCGGAHLQPTLGWWQVKLKLALPQSIPRPVVTALP